MHWNCTRRTKRKWQYFLSREMGSRSQTFPSSYPVPAPQGGQVLWFNNKEDAYPWGCTTQVLLCSPPGAQSAKVLLSNDTFCSACEQHIQANVHDLAYFCFVSRTYPASHGFLKFSQDWFCPLLSTYVWKIPSKGCHKTHRHFPWLLQES